jgi:predicted permease
MAFCTILLFAAGLFAMTFNRLLTRPLGFVDRGVVLLQAESRQSRSPERWAEIVSALRASPRVDAVAMAGWTPLSGNRWRASVAIPGRPGDASAPYCVDVSAGYFEAMRIELLDGREFRPGDAQPTLDERHRPVPGVVIVNETFARVYFGGQNPVGRRSALGRDQPIPIEIVGLVRDAVYDSLRDPMPPTIYVPVAARDNGTLIVRTAADPMSVGAALRRDVSRIDPGVSVRGVALLSSYVTQQMIRERLLAAVSTFFAVVALLLSAIGLYGVLSHAVLRRRREIGIRMALGAGAARIAAGLTTSLASIVGTGAAIGIGAGLIFAGVIQTLLFDVRPTDASALLIPLAAVAIGAVAAALPPVMRAVRIDPVETLRSE